MRLSRIICQKVSKLLEIAKRRVNSTHRLGTATYEDVDAVMRSQGAPFFDVFVKIGKISETVWKNA